MATVDFWSNYRRGQQAREHEETAPIRRRGLESDVGARELALTEGREARDRDSQWYGGISQLAEGDRAQRILNGENVAPREAPGIEASDTAASAASSATGIAAPPLERVASDPSMRDFLRNPQVLDQIAQLAIQTRRPDMVKWLNARYTAEKEGTYDAAEALSRGDVKGALDIFNARGSMKATDAAPAKEGDNRIWNVTLQDGRKIQFDTDTERSMFVDPKGYFQRLEAQRGTLAQKEADARSPEKQAHARYYDAATDVQKATADAIRGGERWRSQQSTQQNGPKQTEINAVHRQISDWAKAMQNDPNSTDKIDPDRVYGMRNLATELMRAGMPAEDALEAVKDAPLPSRAAAMAQAERDFAAAKGRFSSTVEDQGQKLTREQYVQRRAAQLLSKQTEAFNNWRSENGLPGRGAAPSRGGAPSSPNPPVQAIELLKGNDSPQTRAKFDQVFGAGAAERALGGAQQQRRDPAAIIASEEPYRPEPQRRGIVNAVDKEPQELDRIDVQTIKNLAKRGDASAVTALDRYNKYLRSRRSEDAAGIATTPSMLMAP